MGKEDIGVLVPITRTISKFLLHNNDMVLLEGGHCNHVVFSLIEHFLRVHIPYSSNK